MSLDFSFRSMLIDEIVEYEGLLWTEVNISWLSINLGSYQVKAVHVVYGSFCPCIKVLPGVTFRASGCFFSFWSNKTQKQKNRTACRHTLFSQLTILIANYLVDLYNITS